MIAHWAGSRPGRRGGGGKALEGWTCPGHCGACAPSRGEATATIALGAASRKTAIGLPLATGHMHASLRPSEGDVASRLPMRRTQVASAGFKSGPGSPVALSCDQTFAVEFVASKAQILHRHVIEHSLRPICTSSRAACDQWAIDAMAPGKPTVRDNYGEANSPTPCDICLSLACTCPPIPKADWQATHPKPLAISSREEAKPRFSH